MIPPQVDEFGTIALVDAAKVRGWAFRQAIAWH